MLHFRLFGIKTGIYLISFAVPALMHMSGYLYEYLIFLAAITIHEAGHIFCAMLLKLKIDYLFIHPAGFTVHISRLAGASMPDKILIFISGITANLGAAAASICFFAIRPDVFWGMIFFTAANIIIAVFNMLPLSPLDGNRIYIEIVSKYWGRRKGIKIITSVSIAGSLILIIYGAVRLIYNIYDINIFVLGIFLFIMAYKEYKAVEMVSIRDLIYKKERFLKKGIYNVREIVALKTVKMEHLIKNLDYDSYHIINVVDDNSSIVSRITEGRILEEVIKRGVDIPLADIIE